MCLEAELHALIGELVDDGELDRLIAELVDDSDIEQLIAELSGLEPLAFRPERQSY